MKTEKIITWETRCESCSVGPVTTRMIWSSFYGAIVSGTLAFSVVTWGVGIVIPFIIVVFCFIKQVKFTIDPANLSDTGRI